MMNYLISIGYVQIDLVFRSIHS